MTQTEIVESLGMTRFEVFRLEHRSDHRLSTIQRIVEAGGGKLKIFTKFGDKKARLRSAS